MWHTVCTYLGFEIMISDRPLPLAGYMINDIAFAAKFYNTVHDAITAIDEAMS